MELKSITVHSNRIKKKNFNRTSWNWNTLASVTGTGTLTILIEPVGIEIPVKKFQGSIDAGILIEPVGIEIKKYYKKLYYGNNFNRTSWNWNWGVTSSEAEVCNNFNRTSWNWNDSVNDLRKANAIILIEPVGIEIV